MIDTLRWIVESDYQFGTITSLDF